MRYRALYPSHKTTITMFRIQSDAFCESISFVKDGTMRRTGGMYCKVCLEQTGGSLLLRSFNQVAHTLSVLDNEGGTPFRVVFDPDALLGALKRVEGELVIGFSDHHMEIDGPVQLRHACQPGEDFIEFPEPEVDPVLLDGDESLSHAIAQAQKSVDPNSPNRRFAGVYLGDRHTPDMVCCVGANTTSLIEVEMGSSEDASEFSGESIIPAEALDQIRTLLESDENVNLYLGEQQASFVTEQGAVCTRLIMDKYPNYPAIMPDGGQDVTMSRGGLAQALKVCQEYTEDFSSVLIDLEGDSMVVSAAGSESGEASMGLDVDTAEMGRMRLKASADRLLEVVGGMEGREITLLIPIEESPSRIGVVGENDGVSGAVALMMLQPEDELDFEADEELQNAVA